MLCGRVGVVLFWVLIVSVGVIDARIVTRCELTRELIRQHVPRSLLSNWVCLVENESGGNTTASDGPLKDGTYNLGIFKINSKWCRKGYRGGDCNMRCEVLTDNTVADDIHCAQKVFEQGGFKSWTGWINNCKKKPLPNVSDCYRP